MDYILWRTYPSWYNNGTMTEMDDTKKRILEGARKGGATGRAKRLADPRYQAKIATVKAMRAEGRSIRYISEHYGVSYLSMRNFMRTNSIATGEQNASDYARKA